MTLATSHRCSVMLCCIVLLASPGDAFGKPPKTTLKPASAPHRHNPHKRHWPSTRGHLHVHRNHTLGKQYVRARRTVRPSVITTQRAVAVRPDLAVTNIASLPTTGIDETPIWTIQATLQNISSVHFHRVGVTSVFELYKDGELIEKLAFSNVAAGGQLSLTATVSSTPGRYEARIVHLDATGRGNIRPDRDPTNDLLQAAL